MKNKKYRSCKIKIKNNLLLLQIKQILEVHIHVQKQTNLVVVGTIVSESTTKMSWLNFQLEDKTTVLQKNLKKHFGIYKYMNKNR